MARDPSPIQPIRPDGTQKLTKNAAMMFRLQLQLFLGDEIAKANAVQIDGLTGELSTGQRQLGQVAIGGRLRGGHRP